MVSDHSRIKLEINYRKISGKFPNIKQHISKFTEGYKLPALAQEKTGNLSSPIPITEIEFPVYSLHTKKTPGPNVFNGNFYQIFME